MGLLLLLFYSICIRSVQLLSFELKNGRSLQSFSSLQNDILDFTYVHIHQNRSVCMHCACSDHMDSLRTEARGRGGSHGPRMEQIGTCGQQSAAPPEKVSAHLQPPEVLHMPAISTGIIHLSHHPKQSGTEPLPDWGSKTCNTRGLPAGSTLDPFKWMQTDTDLYFSLHFHSS